MRPTLHLQSRERRLAGRARGGVRRAGESRAGETRPAAEPTDVDVAAHKVREAGGPIDPGLLRLPVRLRLRRGGLHLGGVPALRRAAGVVAGHPFRLHARGADYLMCIPEMAREMTSCWISAVPSKMS